MSQQYAQWGTNQSLLNALGLHVHPVHHQLFQKQEAPIVWDIEGPCQVVHLASTSAVEGFHAEGSRLIKVAEDKHYTLKVKRYDCVHVQWKGGQLIWQALPRYDSYTFALYPETPVTGDFQPYDETLIREIPKELFSTHGQVINAMWISILKPSAQLIDLDTIQQAMGEARVVGSGHEDRICMWSPLSPSADGFSRFMVQSLHGNPWEVGGFLQNLARCESDRLFLHTLSLQWEKSCQALKNLEGELNAVLVPRKEENVSLADSDLNRFDRLDRIASSLEEEKLKVIAHLDVVQTLALTINRRTKLWQEKPLYGFQSYTDFCQEHINGHVEKWQDILQRIQNWQNRLTRMGTALHIHMMYRLSSLKRSPSG